MHEENQDEIGPYLCMVELKVKNRSYNNVKVFSEIWHEWRIQSGLQSICTDFVLFYSSIVVWSLSFDLQQALQEKYCAKQNSNMEL